MNRSISLSITALCAALALAACDKPTVVAVPAAPVLVQVPVAVPGPAGPPGAAGEQGATGNTGATGRPGNGATVIVIPPAASAPTN